MPITETFSDGKEDECLVQQSHLLTHDGNDFGGSQQSCSYQRMSTTREFISIATMPNRCRLGYAFARPELFLFTRK